MSDLFSFEPAFPTGFRYIPDFISEEEERRLLSIVTGLEFHSFIFQGFAAKRKVASFGYDYSFDNRRLSKGKAIPSEFNWLIQKAALEVSLEPGEFAELLVIEYPIGAVINWHRDAPPFDIILGISLLSECIFKLRPHDKSLQRRGSLLSFPVKRRSMYIIRDGARTDWQHSTAPAKEIRYSITLRTLRNNKGSHCVNKA